MVLNLVTPGEFFKFILELPSQKSFKWKLELQFRVDSEKEVLPGRKHYEKTY